jgi:reactive chlorine resistance protein C
MQLSQSSQLLGKGIARCCVVLFFLGFGLVKFTAGDWLLRLVDQLLSSDIIGVVEIALAMMMASRFFVPRFCAIGSFGIAASLLVTLSFLVTTPGLDPALGAFIIKDVTLLGVALWSAGEALAVERSAAGTGEVSAGRPAPALS